MAVSADRSRVKPKLKKGLKDADAAAAWFRARVPMTDSEHAELDDRAQSRAFSVAGAAQLRLVADVWDSIDAAIEQGTTLEDFADEVGDKLYAAWGGEDPWRLETIFRTNVQSAYSAGRYFEMNEPAVKKMRPFWRFDAIMDDATTDICADAEGVTLDADDPFWATHTPPLHFNCRSAIVSLATDDVAEGDLTGDTSHAPEAQDGFGDAPQPDDFYAPDLSGYPSELVQILQQRQAP
jgi:SPP1 gp7 family putative phage head morphogenesis protein